MTEKNPATDPAVPAAAAFDNPSTAAPAGAKPGHAAPRGRRGASPAVAALAVVVVLAIVLAAALWMQRKQFLAAAREVATRLDDLNATVGQARSDAQKALNLAQTQSGRAAALENALRETQSQYSALEQAWQNYSDSASDDVLVNDIERLLTIADQQLRLAGSVNNGIVALETAQSRLARADRPRLASLQQTINGDLDRLRAVPTVDVPQQAARIERLSALIAKAPLLVPDSVSPAAWQGGAAIETAAGSAGAEAGGGTGDAAKGVAPAEMVGPGSGTEQLATQQTTAQPAQPPAQPQPQPPQPQPQTAAAGTDAAAAADQPWWQRWRDEMASWPGRAGASLVHEFGDLIRVQRVDEPAALLLSAEQATQLRSMLRQRLLTAQMALLMRQPSVWKSELDAVNTTLNTYFDRRSADTLAALNLARELSQTEISVKLPNVADSLSAIEAVRASATTTSSGRD